ncbi:hypothetical protein BC831DRAFT_263408 [Entophlyctis helioformis]|nr:hypothetical protein BC831DRAFT_263408 [Entophlyctis helioformis]
MSLHSNPGSAAIAGSASGIPAGIPPSKALALAQAPAARASSGPLSASAAAALAHRLASISLHTVGGQTPPASTEPPAPKTTSTPVTTTTPATATGKAGVSMVPRTTSSIDALLASTASPAAASAAAVPVPVPVAVSAADASDFGLLPMQSHFASIKVCLSAYVCLLSVCLRWPVCLLSAMACRSLLADARHYPSNATAFSIAASHRSIASPLPL